MDTRRIWPEVALAGFLHLAWIILLLVNITGGSVSEIPDFFKSLQTGAAALLGSGLIGASYMIGLLTNRLLVLLSEVLHEPSKEEDLLQALTNAPQLEVALEDRSAHKALFRSATVSSPLITLTLLPWACHHQNPSVLWVTIVAGFLFTVLFFVAFWTQWSFHRRLLESMLRSSNEQKS